MLGAILLFSLAIRLPALFIPHIENDEVVYQTLAQKVSVNINDYTLQGTSLIEQLPRAAYDQPLFWHPPLFIYCLALIKLLFGAAYEILLPILCGVLIVLATYLIARKLYSEEHGLISALIMSFCPILIFTSTKIWIETTSNFLMCGALFLLLTAAEKKKILFFFSAGVIWGFSLLAKQTSLAALPAVGYILFRQKMGLRNLLLFGGIFIVTALAINLPWLWHYYKVMGTISYGAQYKAIGEMAEMFLFVKANFSRPFYYYIYALPLVYPVYLFAYAGIFTKLRKRGDLTELIWALSFIGGLIFLIITKHSAPTIRLLVPALPALAILAADTVLRNKRILLPLLLVFLAYGLIVGILNNYLFQRADAYPLTDFLPLIQATPRAGTAI